MNVHTTSVAGVTLTVLQKPAFTMIGYQRPVHLGDGSIARFLRQLGEEDKLEQLESLAGPPRQVWVCLSDCQACGQGCAGNPVCCRVCVEQRDPGEELLLGEGAYVFSLPPSEWALYQAREKTALENLHRAGIYQVVREIGYTWNQALPLHFDNEHQCLRDGAWTPGQTYRLLLPVAPM